MGVFLILPIYISTYKILGSRSPNTLKLQEIIQKGRWFFMLDTANNHCTKQRPADMKLPRFASAGRLLEFRHFVDAIIMNFALN